MFTATVTTKDRTYGYRVDSFREALAEAQSEAKWTNHEVTVTWKDYFKVNTITAQPDGRWK